MLYSNEKYTETTKLEVWKAKIAQNNDPKIWRQDFAGAWIKYEDYGKCTPDTGYG